MKYRKLTDINQEMTASENALQQADQAFLGELQKVAESIRQTAAERPVILLAGPSGSGKTTIFDAIKFALYGVTSDALRTAHDMRSAHASSDDLCYVELLFEHAGHEYRVYRAPAQSRPKKRGEGVTEIRPEASLENVTDGISLASRDSDVTESVIELLGLSLIHI